MRTERLQPIPGLEQMSLKQLAQFLAYFSQGVEDLRGAVERGLLEAGVKDAVDWLNKIEPQVQVSRCWRDPSSLGLLAGLGLLAVLVSTPVWADIIITPAHTPKKPSATCCALNQ